MKRVFIDGSAGTTGLRIYERLSARTDIELLTLSDSDRKVPERRAEMLNAADAAFLCLPDAAAVEAVSLLKNPDTVIFDTSTAHRTNPDWAYGFPELSAAHARSNVRSTVLANGPAMRRWKKSSWRCAPALTCCRISTTSRPIC